MQFQKYDWKEIKINNLEAYQSQWERKFSSRTPYKSSIF